MSKNVHDCLYEYTETLTNLHIYNGNSINKVTFVLKVDNRKNYLLWHFF